ncbi:hypothetical protein [Cysteiniphilum marinum]|uniref:hypothetical protein n=1 Tax=Cysteiniphilum marinum TaxID=2774191 RepID=UPI00193B5866|nr:hypothetical protein [Cysteiniphilum marinum]
MGLTLLVLKKIIKTAAVCINLTSCIYVNSFAANSHEIAGNDMFNAYHKIRFIGYAIPTTVSGLVPVGNVNGKGSVMGYFTGDSDNYKDLKARADILIKAVAKAAEEVKRYKDDDDVINVFVAPEFYFHGIYGPYLWQSSWVYDSPVSYLQKYLQQKLKQYHNWIFVCGTIVTLQTQKSIDELLNQYAQMNTKVSGINKQYIGYMLTKQYAKTDFVAQTLQSFVERSHVEGDVLVRNQAIVINNINEHRSLSVEKRMISNEDLPLASSDDKHQVITEQMSAYPVINLLSKTYDVKQSDNDPYSIFGFHYKAAQGADPGVMNVAVETCLDHGSNRLRENLVENEKVLKSSGLGSSHLQIIPSAGMQIHKSAVIADKDGFVFNVDGEYGMIASAGVNSLYQNYNGKSIRLPYNSPDYPDGVYAYGAHSQLAIVTHKPTGDIGGIDDAQFLNESDLQAKIDTKKVPLANSSLIDHYYAGGAGELHFYGLSQPISLFSSIQ